MFEWFNDNSWVIYTVITVVAFQIGYWVHEKYFMWIMFNYPERILKALELMAKVKAMPEDELADTSRSAIEVLAELDSSQELVIEKEQDRLYAYDKATRAFVAQGSTLEQVFEQARERFPNIKFFGTISQDNSTKELV